MTVPNAKDVKVESLDSGQLKVVIPHPTPATGQSVSVGIAGGLQEHSVTVSQETSPVTDSPPPPTQVIMQGGNNSGGLSGKAATIANMSAVAFVMLMMFMIYSDFRTNVREQNAATRDEMRTTREANERNMGNLNTALNNVSATNITVISELRSSRVAMEAAHKSLLAELFAPRKP